MKTELSLYINGSKIICEQYGNIKNAKKILLFCHGFPGSSRLVRLYDNLKNDLLKSCKVKAKITKTTHNEQTFYLLSIPASENIL